jgi:hypothetical protein
MWRLVLPARLPACAGCCWCCILVVVVVVVVVIVVVVVVVVAAVQHGPIPVTDHVLFLGQ